MLSAVPTVEISSIAALGMIAGMEEPGTVRYTGSTGCFRVADQVHAPVAFSECLPMKILISAEQIQQRLQEMALEIQRDYRHAPVTIIGVLTGSLMFAADLVRRLDLPLRIGFIQASSYRGLATTPGQLYVQPELMPDVQGRHVLLLDDILDTGRTLSTLRQHLRSLDVSSLRVAVLLRKRARQQMELEPDYCGFDIPDKFVVGYGLDYNDEYRHLPYIAELTEGAQS